MEISRQRCEVQILDSGHHLGAIAASAYFHNKDIQLIFDFDKLALNLDLGFENKEFITACAISGEFQAKKVRRLRLKVLFVCGTDYFDIKTEDGYIETASQVSPQKQLEYPQFSFDKEKFFQTVWNRRSSRRFLKGSISASVFCSILQEVEKAIPTENFEEIEIYSVVNRVEGILPGLYYRNHRLKAGDFSDRVGYLCVNQALAKDSAVTLFLVSDYSNYQTAMQIAGFLG